MIEKLRDCVKTLLEEALLVQLEGKVSRDPVRTWDRKEVSRAEKEGPQHGPPRRGGTDVRLSQNSRC